MSDKKISQLTASTTPLTGSEVLAIVQSGTTKQVSVDNLTAGKVVNAGQVTITSTDPVLQFNCTGAIDYNVAASSGNGWYVYDLQNAAVRLFITGPGDVQVSTGNLVIGTSGKGIDFSASGQAAGMTSELLDDYEEGTWTPSAIFSGSNGDLAYDYQVGSYTKVGRLVYLNGYLQFDETTASGDFSIGGLPFAANNSTLNYCGGTLYVDGLTGVSGQIQVLIGADIPSTTMFVFYSGTGTRTRITETNTGANSAFSFAICYAV
jgi:hypothetical protein